MHRVKRIIQWPGLTWDSDLSILRTPWYSQFFAVVIRAVVFDLNVFWFINGELAKPRIDRFYR